MSKVSIPIWKDLSRHAVEFQFTENRKSRREGVCLETNKMVE